ncbi:hypothetical protein AWB69_03092 [Caballeronia udeis]|uniref:Uncharacterized protein n=1 Tax=Caballeronia udeis TaxID=1232866 RepID=A0A158GQG1_9BURK|nr:hypothetical protein AWB69_03092 [Caballeronia udeis]
MTSQYEHPANPALPSITVRAATGQLRVVSVWQAFGRYAVQAQRTTVHCKRKSGLEEMTVVFESISLAELSEIVRRLNALSWVSAASLHVATGAASRERDRSRTEHQSHTPVGEEQEP